MISKIGSLNILAIKDHPELLGKPVLEGVEKLAIGNDIGVVEIDPTLSDTAAFCAKYQVDMNQSANCVILEAARGDKSWLAACVVLANTRADVNGLARRTLDARKVSFAPMEKAVQESGMEYGAITPIGLPADWPILVDKAVADSDYVIIGGGIRKSKIVISGKTLANLPNVKVLEGLGRLVLPDPI